MHDEYYNWDDEWSTQGLYNAKEDEIVNYIKRYPNKNFVRYFMRELNSIKEDVAEFCRDYDDEQ